MLVFAALMLSVVLEAGQGRPSASPKSSATCLLVTHSCCNACLQGIVGYGDIGQACARLAKAFKMKVVALRRNTQLSAAEAAEGVVVSGWGRGGGGLFMWVMGTTL